MPIEKLNIKINNTLMDQENIKKIVNKLNETIDEVNNGGDTKLYRHHITIMTVLNDLEMLCYIVPTFDFYVDTNTSFDTYFYLHIEIFNNSSKEIVTLSEIFNNDNTIKYLATGGAIALQSDELSTGKAITGVTYKKIENTSYLIIEQLDNLTTSYSGIGFGFEINQTNLAKLTIDDDVEEI